MADRDLNRDEAERKQTEETLRERDELFRVLTGQAEELIRLHDLDGRNVYASQSVERLCGRVPPTLFDLGHPEDVENCQRWWRMLLAGETDHLRWRVRDAGGRWRWLETSATLVQYHDRPHVLTVCRDISDRKQAEEELRLIIDTIPTMVFTSLPDGFVDNINQRWRQFMGLPLESVQGWNWEGTIHPEDRARSIEHWRSTMAAGQASENELRVRRADGVYRWILGRFAPLHDESGKIVRWYGASTDIDDRKRAEEALHAAEHRLHHVVASSPAVLYTLRAEDGHFRGITWMSENIQAMLGYRDEETLGADWWMSNLHPEDREAVIAQFLSEMSSSGFMVAEFRMLHRDGRYRWIRGENRLLRDAAGRPSEVVGSWADVTERKRLEDQFRQAQKMEAVGHLAGGVAHDFNNLLTIISGYSEILLPGLQPTDPRREMVIQIQQAGARAAGLTRQLLAFSRQMVLEPKILDLNDVVRENEKMLRRFIGEDVQLTAVLDTALRPVKVDPGQTSQVIMNLAVNARDAMPTGGKLTIETGNVKLDDASAVMDPEVKPGRYVLLAVTDTGTGMTPEVLAHIFEPFFTTKGPGKGTGLGLATVYGIVKQSGGFISVHSEPGRGTAFKIYFPVVEGRVPTGKSLQGLAPVARGTETILLVEDEEAVRAILRVSLQQAGYLVLEAGRGAEAIRLVGEHPGPVHLLIADVVMPEMGGRELVERLAPLQPGLKVLYLSGYTDDAVVRHGVLQADVAFLQKPFTMAALTNKVRQALDAAD